jgi:hypothetical protein
MCNNSTIYLATFGETNQGMIVCLVPVFTGQVHTVNVGVAHPDYITVSLNTWVKS